MVHRASLAIALARLWELGTVDVALMVTGEKVTFLKTEFYTNSYIASAEWCAQHGRFRIKSIEILLYK